MFRFSRVLTMENGTDPKSETSIRSAIKFATKALKIPYLYVNSSKSYEHEHTFRPFGSEKKKMMTTEKNRTSWKNIIETICALLQLLRTHTSPLTILFYTNSTTNYCAIFKITWALLLLTVSRGKTNLMPLDSSFDWVRQCRKLVFVQDDFLQGQQDTVVFVNLNVMIACAMIVDSGLHISILFWLSSKWIMAEIWCYLLVRFNRCNVMR